VHNESRDAAAARMRQSALEQHTAQPAGPMRREDREAHFGEIIHDGHMRDTRKLAAIVVYAENRVAPEVDPVDVRRDPFWRKGCAEPQAQVPHGQRCKMRDERGTHAVTELCDQHG